jgi:exonuclease I
MHILKIQKELISISNEQSDMNNNIIQIYASLNKMQNFQLEQYKFNEEVAKGFQQIADRDLVRQLQDIDPTKIGRA